MTWTTSSTIVFLILAVVSLFFLAVTQVEASPVHERQIVQQDWENEQNSASGHKAGRHHKMMRDPIISYSSNDRQTAENVFETMPYSSHRHHAMDRERKHHAPRGKKMYRNKRNNFCPFKKIIC